MCALVRFVDFRPKMVGKMQISLGLTCFQFALAFVLLSSHTRLGLCGRNRKNGNAELKSRAVNEIKNVLAEVAKVYKEWLIGFARKRRKGGVTRSGIDAIIGGSHGAVVRIVSERNERY